MESFDSAVSVRDEMAVVEKVARAALEASRDGGWTYVGYGDVTEGPITVDGQVDFMEVARAAIKAYAEAIRGWSVE